MKNSLFISTLLGASLSMAFVANASADHRHKHRHYHHDHDYVVVKERVVYEDRYERYGDYDRVANGRVINARPIYQRVAVDVPRQSCRVETVAHEERRRGGDSFAGTVIGGLMGGAIGHELGNGRGAATAVGGLIGASIGNDAGKGSRVVRYHDEEVCNTRYRTEYEQRIVGYDVSYSYQGRVYQTRTDRHPGDRIAVAVDARPNYRD
ncbi:MAG: hypothetical protein EOO68_12485 [Moraxellaceae bacterium]|nr:MAG: hypothetical protein EOO68_12485 [Moraxellaceae bacterium]